MSSITAQILLGHAHQNHGGIIPICQMFLSENDRPAWILQNVDVSSSGEPTERIVWIPTVEHMLEDGLLLLAVHGIKSETCIQIMGDTFVSEGTGPLELYKISNEIRNKLYQQCRFLAYPHKIVVTILEGSTVASQVNVLKDYQLDVEVCPVVYSRQYATWAGKTQEFGSLEMKTKD